MVESYWLKLKIQLLFLQKISKDFSEEYRDHQSKVLKVLQIHIQTALSLVKRTTSGVDDDRWFKNLRRVKYAVFVKGDLNKVVANLGEWSRAYDISWYLIIQIRSSDIDKALETVQADSKDPLSTMKSLRTAFQANLDSNLVGGEGSDTVFLDGNVFHGSRYAIEGSRMEIWHDTDGTTQYLMGEPTNLTTDIDARNLAKILRHIDPSVFSIPRCTGLVRSVGDVQKEFRATRFVFEIPGHLGNPQHLRTVCDSNIYSLDDRFALAKQLARAVMFVHSCGLVHKNIRPETVLTFQNQDSKELCAFLTGFENFRSVMGRTLYKGDDEWQKNLYRHPTRQGVKPEWEYCMQHDIYSLGVCLLELGLMTSFVLQDAKNNKLVPNPMVASITDATIKDNRKRGFECQRVLVKLAQGSLPQKMGRRYAEMVVTCLTCLDKTNNDFGAEKEFQDENGIVVGVRYIEKV